MKKIKDYSPEEARHMYHELKDKRDNLIREMTSAINYRFEKPMKKYWDIYAKTL